MRVVAEQEEEEEEEEEEESGIGAFNDICHGGSLTECCSREMGPALHKLKGHKIAPMPSSFFMSAPACCPRPPDMRISPQFRHFQYEGY